MNDSTDDLLGERGKKYGPAVRTHTRIALVWSGILDTEVTAQQVALCMAGLKAVRSSVTPEYGDNYDDLKGYARIAEMISATLPDVDAPLPVKLTKVGEDAFQVTSSLEGDTYAMACRRLAREGQLNQSPLVRDDVDPHAWPQHGFISSAVPE